MGIFNSTFIPHTDKYLSTSITFGEFLESMDIWTVMGRTEGKQHIYFQLSKPINMLEGGIALIKPSAVNSTLQEHYYSSSIHCYTLSYTSWQFPMNQGSTWWQRRIIVAKGNQRQQHTRTHVGVYSWIECHTTWDSQWPDLKLSLSTRTRLCNNFGRDIWVCSINRNIQWSGDVHHTKLSKKDSFDIQLTGAFPVALHL